MLTEDGYVTTASGRLAVRDHGGPSGSVPLVLVHGLASNLCIWDLVAPRLAARHRVVAYDQRGHGHSDDGDGDYSYAAVSGDCAEVVERLGLDHPVVVGHSWGASVVLHYAATHPGCRGVVCVDGGLIDLQGMGMDWPGAEERLRPPHLEGDPDELVEVIRSAQPYLPDDAAQAVIRRAFVVGEDGVMRRRTPISEHMKIVRHMWDERIWTLYDRISCRVLLVMARTEGGGGYTAAKEAAAERVMQQENVSVEWIESVHDVPLARPDELTDLIESFAFAL